MPRKALILLESLVGEKALLNLGRMAGRYDPEEEIIFVFLFKKDQLGVTSAYRVGNLGGKPTGTQGKRKSRSMAKSFFHLRGYLEAIYSAIDP